MSVREFFGGPMNQRYLMRKSKSELADIILRMINDKPSQLVTCGVRVQVDATIPADRVEFRGRNGELLCSVVNIGRVV